jgi:hypothetical protein
MAWNVADGQLSLPGDLHSHFSHIVHGHIFIRTDVQRHFVIRVEKSPNTLDGIIDVAERTSLIAVTPHFKINSGANGLTKKSGWGLFPTAAPRSVRAIDIVKTGDAKLHARIVLSVVDAKLFGDELLKSVSILRLSRPRVTFLETE